MQSHTIVRPTLAVAFLAVGFTQVASTAAADGDKKLASAVRESALANDFSNFIRPFRKVRGSREHIIQWWSAADASPVKCGGTGKAKWVHENRVISQEISAKWLGEVFEATLLFGYDNTLGRYTCLWLDSLSNRMIFFSGKPDESGQVVTFTGETGDALSREPVKVRCVMQLPDRDGEIKTEFFRTDTGGSEYKFMEVVSKRRVVRAG